MKNLFIMLAFTLLAAVSAGAQSFAMPGTPDREFGRKGFISETVSDQSRVIIPIDVVGNPDGSFVVVSSAVAVFPGSGAPIRFHLAKYNADGLRDYSFGILSEVDDSFTVTASPVAATLQPDGKIVVAGNIRDAGAPTDFLVARYHADGRRDLAFGNGGFVRVDFGSFGVASADVAKRVFINADGKISVVGYRTVSDGVDPANDYIAAAVLRIEADGTPDDSFGQGGKSLPVELAVAGQFAMGDVRKLAGGGFLLGFAGRKQIGSNPVARLVQLGADANPDATFGDRGFIDVTSAGVMSPVGQMPGGDLFVATTAGLLAVKSDGSVRGWLMPQSILVNEAVFRPVSYAADSDGAVIGVGTAERNGVRRQAMIRMSGDGRIDQNFGVNGLREESRDVSSLRSARTIQLPNGRILAIHQTTDFNRVLIQRWHGPAATSAKSPRKSFLK